MTRDLLTLILALSCSSLACTGSSPPPASEKSIVEAKAPDAKITEAKAPEAKAAEATIANVTASPAKVGDAKAPELPAPPVIEPTAEPIAEPIAEPVAEPIVEPIAEAAPTEPVPPTPVVEVAIKPWSITAHTAAWTLAAEPAAPLALIDLRAGLLARAGTKWWQIADDGALTAVEMSVEPELPILGVWPTDAWFVNQRFRNYGDGSDTEYLKLRLMKLRGTNRWVPQVYSGNGEQWFHPGTDDEDEPHISALSGMLVYPRSLQQITRVAGKHPDPVIGPHRGDAIDFLEAASGKVYVLSRDAEGTYAQIACEDEVCVAANVRKLPLAGWSFGPRLARGKHSVTVLATGESREFMLHHQGKSGGWVLDELPAGERPSGMWASAEGGLWTLTGERLRWRDTDGGWHNVALPEGLTGPSVAVGQDRTRLWVSGVVGGAAKVFTTPANASP